MSIKCKAVHISLLKSSLSLDKTVYHNLTIDENCYFNDITNDTVLVQFQRIMFTLVNCAPFILHSMS